MIFNELMNMQASIITIDSLNYNFGAWCMCAMCHGPTLILSLLFLFPTFTNGATHILDAI
jgi:hypothetical protein